MDRILHRRPHLRLGGEMEHDLGCEAGEEVDEFGRTNIGDVHAHAPAPGVAEVLHLPRRQVVDDEHVPIAVEEHFGEVAADESGTGGDDGPACYGFLNSWDRK